jgi:peptide/nickel transport system substrate-binding protein
METTYPLRANLSWHDGPPLTAEDFVFSWRVYAEPQLGQASSTPFNSIEEVVAPDPQTVVIRWKRPFPLAGSLTGEFPPVPRHLLQPAFDQLQSGAIGADAFIRQPYWTSEFVGAGPYKLERWESGVSLEGVAFDQHVLGRPRIDRVRVGFSTDQNASLAQMLAGYVDYASDSAIGNPQALTLKHTWAQDRGGAIFVKLDFFRAAYTQLRPEQATPPAIMDVRVRQALAYTVDRQALHDGLDGFEGGNIDAEGPFIPPNASYYAQVDRAITKYPYDPQRAVQLMADAGLTRGADGFYQSAADGRLRWEVKTSGSVDNEAEISILANTWRQAGFDFQQAVLPAAQAQDGQARATFPTLYSFGTSVGENMLIGMNTTGIPRPENRWSGSNRGGWSNPEFDRLSDSIGQTLDPDRRAQLIAQMTAMVSREAVTIPLFFYGNPLAATAAIVGPGPVVQETPFEWNIHEWEIAR